jgi:hypothetical protein
MVGRGRRFESVRGLRVSSCSASSSVVPAGGKSRLRRPPSVHQRPPWPLSGAQLVEQADRMREVAVVAVDHGQAGAHVAGEVEGGDAGTECEDREGVSEIVDPAQGSIPAAICAASIRGYGSCGGRGSRPARQGEQRTVRTRRLGFDRVQRDHLQRLGPSARLSLGALQPTLRERTADIAGGAQGVRPG